MDITALLRELCALPGVSGRESRVTGRIGAYLSDMGATVESDKLGNCIAFINTFDPARRTLLLDAHIDEIGMFVTEITEEGFLRFYPNGIDPRTLPAHEVIIHGSRELTGVVACLPPHIQTPEQQAKLVPVEEMAIDTGYSREQLQKLVPIGTEITLKAKFTELLNGYIATKSLDNRASFVAVASAAEQLKGRDLPFNLVLCGTVQEEVGTRGIRTAGYTVNPDYAIVVDATFGRTPDTTEDEAFKTGGGPTIGRGPHMHKDFTDHIVGTAKRLGLPYQIEVMSGRTGTNGGPIQVCRDGVASAIVSIPVKYMHTPFETVCLSDIEAAATLIAESAAGFIPERGLSR